MCEVSRWKRICLCCARMKVEVVRLAFRSRGDAMRCDDVPNAKVANPPISFASVARPFGGSHASPSI
jgi:hypothetical protein